MSKETQIKEMQTVVNGAFFEDFRNGNGVCIKTISEHLYNAGYRKQSEAEWTYGENNTMKCTLCRRRMPKIILARFCPNCGAKMKGV